MDDGDADPYSTRLTKQTGGGHNSILWMNKHNLLMVFHNGVCFFAFVPFR